MSSLHWPHARFALATSLLFLCLGGTPVFAQSSPTAAMQSYHDAAKRKDYEKLKSVLSSAYLMELAKAPVPFERLMQPITEDVPATMPATRNEKIAGERATLEVQDHKTRRWDIVKFVRERGAWKLALGEKE
jgi:hypothetical protein